MINSELFFLSIMGIIGFLGVSNMSFAILMTTTMCTLLAVECAGRAGHRRGAPRAVRLRWFRGLGFRGLGF